MIRSIIFTTSVIVVVTIIGSHIKNRIKEQREADKRKKQNKEAPIIQQTEGKYQLSIDEAEKSLNRFYMLIGNSDQKAGILIAIEGVVFTIFLSSDAVKMLRTYIFRPFLDYCNGTEGIVFNESRFWVFFLFCLTLVMAIVSLLYLLKVIKPNIDYAKMYEENPGMEKTSYRFFGDIVNMTYEHYKTDAVDYNNDLSSQAYTNAKIAQTKFQNYIEGLFYFKILMLTAFLLFVAVMIMI